MRTCARRTSSPTLIELPPHDGLTFIGTTLPSFPGAPGPAATTEASGSGDEAEDEGRKMPDAVLVSGLKRLTSTRSSSGITEEIERIVVDD